MSPAQVRGAPPGALDRVMSDPRRRVTAVLVALLGLALLLWLVRGPRPIAANLPFLLVSALLTPVAYGAVFGLLYLWLRNGGPDSAGAYRAACAIVFFAGSAWLAASTLRALREFMTHRPVAGANFVALGLAVGALRAWQLQLRRDDA